MRIRPYLAALALVGGGAHAAGDPRDPMEVLAQARAGIVAIMKRLPRYTCVQTVERKSFGVVRTGRGATPPKMCPQIVFEKNSGRSAVQLVLMDRLRLDVAVSASGEIYSWVGASQFDSRPLAEMIGGGVVSTGAFGTYLVDVFENPAAAYRFVRKTSAGARVLFEYAYRVAAENSHYEVGIPGAVNGGMLGSWYKAGHEGSFMIDPESLDLVHLTIRTDLLPPMTEMCQATTSLDYQRLRIGEQDFLLPRTSALDLVGTDGHESQTTTTFSGCRQYGAESTVQFGDEASAADGAGKAAAGPPLSLPAWLPVTLSLASPIDTEKAAVGDLIRATLTEPVRRPDSREVLLPAGAVFKGRLNRMERRLVPKDLFLIGMSFDSVEVNGVAAPCRLVLDMTRRSRTQLELTAELPPTDAGGLFPFPAGKKPAVVPAGYKMGWLTAKPAASAAK
jgi:hypothetical protein